MKEIVIATANPKKSKELKDILYSSGYKALDLNDIRLHDEIDENGITLHENAYIKARYLFEKTGKISFGEDSGLEVTALENRPGVFSARFAGPQKNDTDNIVKLLEELDGKNDRSAQFRTVIALVSSSGSHYFEGVIKGHIIDEVRGHGGFGYDPVFIPEGYQNTFAELPSDVKNTISHRAKAIEKLVDYLNKNSI